MDGTDLTENHSLAKQRVVVQNLDTARPSGVPEEVDDEEDNWEVEGMLTAEELTTSSLHEKLRGVQGVCEGGGDTVHATIVDVIQLACEGSEIGRKNAAMFSRQTDLEAELVEVWAAERTMPGQITAAGDWIKTLKTQLFNARVALEKLVEKSARSKADL